MFFLVRRDSSDLPPVAKALLQMIDLILLDRAHLYWSIMRRLMVLAGDKNKLAFADLALRAEVLELTTYYPGAIGLYPEICAPDFLRLLCDVSVWDGSGPRGVIAFDTKSRDKWLREIFPAAVRALRERSLVEAEVPQWCNHLLTEAGVSPELRSELMADAGLA